MTDRKDQPAALKRKVERLERLLAAERELRRKAYAVYSDQLAQIVDLKMRLEAVSRAVHGEIA